MMISRRAAIGLALACALAFSAFAAPSAMAIKGTTAFTCRPEKPVSGVGFSDAHCKTPVNTGANFVHNAFNVETKFHATNEKTDPTTTNAEPFVTKAKPLGIETEIVCKKVTEHGNIANQDNPTNLEHKVVSNAITTHYTECSVPKPAGCKIPEKTILVENLKATTKGEEMNGKFSPEVGNTFVEFSFEGCTSGLFNGVHKVEGTVRAQNEGATGVTNEATVTAEKI